ncbi:MAG: GGDEF domain-containing protein [Desulfobacterales bacterium]|jgi:diguanylate cyclase (GGDEF)-like protein
MKEEDFTHLGRTDLLDADSQIQVGAGHPYLIVFIGRDAGRRFKLEPGRMTVGRSPQADIKISDHRVSRIHCTFEWDDENITVEDNESTNGTFVDSHKINRTKVLPGIPIQLGQSVMKIEYKDEAEIQSEENLLRQVSVDPLTSIFCRQHFLRLASMEMAYACRHQLPVGVIMLVIDNFNQITDTHGNQGGEFALARTAGIVSKTIRTEDLLARYTEEEFIIMPRGDINKEDMLVQCERIRKAIKDFEFRFGEEIIQITLSLGYHFEKLKGKDFKDKLSDLIANAEHALYLAKGRGGDRIETIL